MALVNVLIPTCRRKTGLAVVLTSLLGQTFTDFSVTISDQTPPDAAYLNSIEIRTLVEALRWHGHSVSLLHHLPPRGLAEQRQFLLEQSDAPYVHYLDDDRHYNATALFEELIHEFSVYPVGPVEPVYDPISTLAEHVPAL